LARRVVQPLQVAATVTAVLPRGLTAAATAAAAGMRRHRDDAVIVLDYVGERNLFSIVNDR